MMSFALISYLLLSLIFLLPLKDEGRTSKRWPVATLTLIGINVIAHVVFHYVVIPQLKDEKAFASFIQNFLLVPANIRAGVGLGAISVLTAAFLHIDWQHLLGNMFFLYFFGRKVEDMLGTWKMILFYMVCIYLSATGSILGRLALPITKGENPALGASGAIMGLVAAYLFLYSNQRIRTLVILVFIPFTIKMPAWVFIIYTVVRDAMGALLQQEVQIRGYVFGGVDFFAHLGGFAAGLISVYFFLPGEVLHYRRRISSR